MPELISCLQLSLGLKIADFGENEYHTHVHALVITEIIELEISSFLPYVCPH